MRAPLLLLASVAASANAAGPAAGYVFFCYHSGVLSSNTSDASMAELRSSGATHIEIGMTDYIANINSTRIFVDPQASPTDADVRHAIQTAQKLGFTIALKPHIDSQDGIWRGEIGKTYTSEQQWADWFSNYTVFITHWAALAEAAGVPLFNVGTELDSTEPRVAQWRAVIAAVRAVFSGQLWYGCNWSPGPYAVAFWDALDFIGVDAYYPLATAPDAPLATLVAAWQPILANLSALSAANGGKKIIFAEIGYASWSGSSMQPWACCSGLPDLAAQATAYTAFFQAAWGLPWFGGVYWWSWNAADALGSKCSTDFNIWKKTAFNVVQQYYGRPPATASKSKAAPLVVYSNGQTAWQDWSWSATVNMQDTSNPYPGHTASLTAAIATGGALVLHQAGTDVSPYTSFSFNLVLSNVSLSTELSIYFCSCDDCTSCSLPGRPVADYGVASSSCLLPQAWGGGSASLFQVPLADLGIAPGTTTVNRIQWSHSGGSAAYNTTIALDNVQFV